MLFLCNFEQSDENNFSYQYIAFAIEGGSSWKNTPYHWFLDKKWGNMNFYFIWATPILLNISRESFFILFTYAQKPIPNAQIDNEVFRSGAPLYIVSVTVVINLLPHETRFAPWLCMTLLVDPVIVDWGWNLRSCIDWEAVVQLWWPCTASSSPAVTRNWEERL